MEICFFSFWRLVNSRCRCQSDWERNKSRVIETRLFLLWAAMGCPSFGLRDLLYFTVAIWSWVQSCITMATFPLEWVYTLSRHRCGEGRKNYCSWLQLLFEPLLDTQALISSAPALQMAAAPYEFEGLPLILPTSPGPVLVDCGRWAKACQLHPSPRLSLLSADRLNACFSTSAFFPINKTRKGKHADGGGVVGLCFKLSRILLQG